MNPLPDLTPEEAARYARHTVLPEVGIEGQRKLKAASVLVVGLGGLGSANCLYLAAAGVGHLGVVDDDVVDASNLQRQVIHDTPHLDQPKVESARERMLAINPHLQVDIYGNRFTADNAPQIVTGYNIIVDGTDNFATRYLINEACAKIGKPYVYGSIYRFEGQVSVFDSHRGPCYRCLYPDPPPEVTAPADRGVLGILPGTIGTLQATEVIKLILGLGTPLIGKLLLYDARTMSFDVVEFGKQSECPVCGTIAS